MGTKLEPDGYYERAEPNEPMFILLARDASAPALVELWAAERERHGEHAAIVAEARECADQMRVWRDTNRPSPPTVIIRSFDLDWTECTDDALHEIRNRAERIGGSVHIELRSGV